MAFGKKSALPQKKNVISQLQMPEKSAKGQKNAKAFVLPKQKKFPAEK